MDRQTTLGWTDEIGPGFDGIDTSGPMRELTADELIQRRDELRGLGIQKRIQQLDELIGQRMGEQRERPESPKISVSGPKATITLEPRIPGTFSAAELAALSRVAHGEFIEPVVDRRNMIASYWALPAEARRDWIDRMLVVLNELVLVR